MKPATLIRPVILASLLGGAVALAACIPGPTGVEVPAAGTELNETHWNAYMPEYKVGMKLTYAHTHTFGETVETGETSTEVLKIENGIVTLKNTEVDGSTSEATDSVKPKFHSPFPLISKGASDVTVPAGTFKGAAKFEGTDPDSGATAMMWLVPGKGYVKFQTTGTVGEDSYTSVMELKSFKN